MILVKVELDIFPVKEYSNTLLFFFLFSGPIFSGNQTNVPARTETTSKAKRVAKRVSKRSDSMKPKSRKTKPRKEK